MTFEQCIATKEHTSVKKRALSIGHQLSIHYFFRNVIILIKGKKETGRVPSLESVPFTLINLFKDW